MSGPKQQHSDLGFELSRTVSSSSSTSSSKRGIVLFLMLFLLSYLHKSKHQVSASAAFVGSPFLKRHKNSITRQQTYLFSETMPKTNNKRVLMDVNANHNNCNGNVQQPQESKTIRAKIVNDDKLQECGERLRQGDLVSFPTETVYGLGCNALDESAIRKVFLAKERPLTDPLITHVSDPIDAYNLWNASEDSLEGKALRILCGEFWPGPLTLVAKAAPHVPPLLMANTGFVACRSPQHPLSINLINAAKVPLAAPSANKFGHVSPTRAEHVWDDLLYEDVWIINAVGDGKNNNSKQTIDVCDVGVESSVAKMEMMSENNGGKIILLRQGAVSIQDIETCLEKSGLDDFFVVEAQTKESCSETVANVAPGQTIRHYSPDIPSYSVSLARCDEVNAKASEDDPSSFSCSQQQLDDDEILYLSKSVIIDFGSKLVSWKQHATAYVDLSDIGDSAEATKSLFETLRWAERVDGADRIIFPEVDENGADALALALKDRLTRAASGVVIDTIKI